VDTPGVIRVALVAAVLLVIGGAISFGGIRGGTSSEDA
jgi:hypothetical protein